MAQDLIYSNTEWELDGAVISADVELTLTVDLFEGEPSFKLYIVKYQGQYTAGGGWLYAVMDAWVWQNQDKLEQRYYDSTREAA